MLCSFETRHHVWQTICLFLQCACTVRDDCITFVACNPCHQCYCVFGYTLLHYLLTYFVVQWTPQARRSHSPEFQELRFTSHITSVRRVEGSFFFLHNASVEPCNINEGRGVGYLADKLEVCCLSPATLHPSPPSCSIIPTDWIKLLCDLFQTDPLSANAENDSCMLCGHISDPS